MTEDLRVEEIVAKLRVIAGEINEGMEGLSDEELAEAKAALDALRRVLWAAQIRVAGEVGVRSRSELGDKGLSRSMGFTSPAELISSITGISLRESEARLELGLRLRGAVLPDTSAPPRTAHSLPETTDASGPTATDPPSFCETQII